MQFSSEFTSAVHFYCESSEFLNLDGSTVLCSLTFDQQTSGILEKLSIPPKLFPGTLTYYPSKCAYENLKCHLSAEVFGFVLGISSDTAPYGYTSPVLIDMQFSNRMIFGANSICKYLAVKSQLAGNTSSSLSHSVKRINLDLEDVLYEEETVLSPCLIAAITTSSTGLLISVLQQIECFLHHIASDAVSIVVYYPTFKQAIDYLVAKAINTQIQLPQIFSFTQTISASSILQKINNKATQSQPSSNLTSTVAIAPTLKPIEVMEVDWMATGLFSALRQLFSVAIHTAIPQVLSVSEAEPSLSVAVITRCGNPAHGDYQCNNAMAIAKMLKSVVAYTGPKSPKDIADAIVKCTPKCSLIDSLSSAPNGFINIRIPSKTFQSYLSSIVQNGVRPPHMTPLKTLVDFSSPNIAKEMHVGHLRSTIIGDCICRILEFCGHEVLRTNHVGDWGTQFGMLITYLQEEFPDILTDPPNISDLTAIYKKSKQRFDADEQFKETSRLNVVKLQSGDPGCHAIWTLLCNISRKEFQKVYDLLDVKLNEVGESFYNPIIPRVIDELEKSGLIEVEDGMLIIRQAEHPIPLIVRKSDGGYGYDSTDMAAMSYRLRDLQREWIVIITDAGQANHFYMCFDAARKMNWVTNNQRLDHIGFGVVCGEDGKRFKTRSSETIRLVDLLNAAKDRMKESLESRAAEGKSPLQGEELDKAASIIGYGAVKYFDLKQHPVTNYIFSYDRVLDTRGDTAVYLLFAYARLASILRKAEEERGIILKDLYNNSSSFITLTHPAERALAFELMQFNDVLRSVLADLLPNRLCDYLSQICTTFTDFVTKCHVLNADETNSRLILCEATRQVMAKCFDLLGIGTLERI